MEKNMNYTQAINYIHSIPKFRRPLGNANLEKLLCAMGNPHRKQRFIHIAGTNGKGSTAAMTAQILKESGYKVGLFTSPYIEVFNERIRINGENISNEEIAKYTARVKETMERNNAPVSEFAFVTAAALLYFYEKECDFVVLEVGMGGKLDATNVISDSVVSVICKIGIDHTQYLGNTIEEITLEKCGIIRKKGCVVSHPNNAVREIIRRCADEKDARLIFAEDASACEGGFLYKGKKYPLSLKGSYQPQNAAVVVEIVNAMRSKGFFIPEEAVCKGFANTSWAARFEYMSENVIIDGGHNMDGIRALKKSLEDLKRDVVLVIAMMEDKDYENCIRYLVPAAKSVVATELDMPRCLVAERIFDIVSELGIPVQVIKNPISALDEAIKISDNAVVCVCGSLYLAGEIRKKFTKS
jgi:dihydrofolate synthase/folylpolyglutamate synthase